MHDAGLLLLASDMSKGRDRLLAGDKAMTCSCSKHLLHALTGLLGCRIHCWLLVAFGLCVPSSLFQGKTQATFCSEDKSLLGHTAQHWSADLTNVELTIGIKKQSLLSQIEDLAGQSSCLRSMRMVRFWSSPNEQVLILCKFSMCVMSKTQHQL